MSSAFAMWHISTHAPARGATYSAETVHHKLLISTHAPARGATACPASLVMYIEFQPTLLHEERRRRGSVYGQEANFNPRSCTRSDLAVPRKVDSKVISTHAPARGATSAHCRFQVGAIAISTHAPARGATLSPPTVRPDLMVFQPTLLHEERRHMLCMKWIA